MKNKQRKVQETNMETGYLDGKGGCQAVGGGETVWNCTRGNVWIMTNHKNCAA